MFSVSTTLGGRIVCRPGESLLAAAERNQGGGITVGCRGGGCGVCKIRVVHGRFRVGPMSRAKVSDREVAEGYALACRVYPEDDLVIDVNGFS